MEDVMLEREADTEFLQLLRYVNAWVSVCVFSENRQKIIKK